MISPPETQELTPTERAELNWLLDSGALGRSANIARVLRYICEQTAAGNTRQLKEYSIGVEALGRRPDFDPQTDTIVRVTVHALRKRLQEAYTNGPGTERPFRIHIPPGSYSAVFLPQNPASRESSARGDDMAVPPPLPLPYPVTPPPSARPHTAQYVAGRKWLVLSALGAGVIGVWLWPHRRTSAVPVPSVRTHVAAIPGPAPLVRTLFGSKRATYVDHSGQTWSHGDFCTGGSDSPAPSASIGGTEDPQIFSAGVRGMVHCIFPLKRGIYELHLHFAEPTDLEAARLSASISVNAQPPSRVDVVDRAGGDRLATTLVLPGILPENDGAIHLDYISEVSPLNALEILPAPSTALLPVRIVAASQPFVDADKQLWLSDRYFSGGRRGQPPDPAHQPGLGLFASNRVGSFQYRIPVAPSGTYTVRLYFREPWFGQENGIAGGPGSRVFNVSCNGNMVLSDFDILAEAHSASVVKTLRHIKPTSLGTIQLSFLPVVNYPIVNAIEVLPEP